SLSYVIFFFSSRRRHTRWPRDWSSDVCSSDLFVQIKTGALTTERIAAARKRGRSVVTTDTYKSMAYARAVAALGIGSATGEIPSARLADDVIVRDLSVFSNVASTSSGVERMNCEIIALG